MQRIIYQFSVILLLSAIGVAPLEVHAQRENAQTDTGWTGDKAEKWFAAMDWYRGGRGVGSKKKYDAFGRELEDLAEDTASTIIVNAGLIPDPSVNKVEFARQYHANPSRWDKAFAYLKNTDLQALPPGRYPIDGNDVYATITLGPPRKIDSTLWESHRNFEDIHYVISGKEQIGIVPLAKTRVVKKYDSALDLAEYSAEGSYYVAKPGLFFIITTEEAHRPGLRAEGYDRVKKLVIKVRKS